MLQVAQQLQHNKLVFLELLKDVELGMIHWKQDKDTWCLLEILCHLYDEERDDFRFRVNWLLEKPGETPPPFNPMEWVLDHNYMQQDYEPMLYKFIAERENSLRWLNSLNNPNWGNYFKHPKLGKLSASYYLNNWLAHDYLHIRQILKLKFDYLEHVSGNDLNYAGKW